jgi:uncharacterized protein
VKFQIIDIRDEGLDLAFDLDAEQTTELLGDPRREYQGAPGGLRVKAHVRMVQDTILVRGDVDVYLMATCVRCLGSKPLEMHLALDEALFPRPDRPTEAEEVELDSEDLDMAFYEGSEVDLEPFVRELIFLEVPSYPGCDAEEMLSCPLYQEFSQAQGQSDAPEADGDDIDPRWNALRALKERMSQDDPKN